MGGESLRIGILQLKQLKAYNKIRRVDLLCSFKLHVHPLGSATGFTHLPSVLLTPCLSWLPTLPACRAQHTAAQVGCWPVARWTWPAAAAIHMGDEARTANIAVLHECSLMRTRAGSTRDQFQHDMNPVSTTCSPVEALRNSSLFQIVHRGLVFLECCVDTCQQQVNLWWKLMQWFCNWQIMAA